MALGIALNPARQAGWAEGSDQLIGQFGLTFLNRNSRTSRQAALAPARGLS
jgi:hypothetical protein